MTTTVPQTMTAANVPVTAENFLLYTADDDGNLPTDRSDVGLLLARYIAHYRDGDGGRTTINVRAGVHHPGEDGQVIRYIYKIVTAVWDRAAECWDDHRTTTIAIAPAGVETAAAWLETAAPAAPPAEPAEVEVTFAIHEWRSFAASVRIDPAAFAAYMGVPLADAPEEAVAHYIRVFELRPSLVDGGTEETWEDFTVVS